MTQDSQQPTDQPADEPVDAPQGADSEKEGQPDPKAAGSTGWQALAPPGKPDGEVDTRP